MPQSELFLSNDAVGTAFSEEIFRVQLASTTSALTGSATSVPVGFLTKNGRVVSAWIGVGQPALSASGFVSGTVGFTPRINSVAVCSTDASIDMVATSALAVKTTTFAAASAAGVVKPVINQASAQFSTGDVLSYDYNLRSVGSAAAGAAGVGFYAAVVVRYDAV